MENFYDNADREIRINLIKLYLAERERMYVPIFEQEIVSDLLFV